MVGQGVLAASGDVLCALLRPARRGVATEPPLDGTFEQALTIVYRILFLLFAEARGLVPLWHSVYRESYSVESLRSAAENPETAAGLWEQSDARGRVGAWFFIFEQVIEIARTGMRVGAETATRARRRIVQAQE